MPKGKNGQGVYRLCRVAMLAALYILLNNTIAIKAGTLRITFASLPVVVSALLFGPGEAALTALVGEAVNQLRNYGLGVTTALWLLPPVVRGTLVGLAARPLRDTERPLERRPALCYAVCILAALCTTAVNTAVTALDAWILHYYSTAYVFGNLAHRSLSGIVVAAVVATVAMPVSSLLRRRGFCA